MDSRQDTESLGSTGSPVSSGASPHLRSNTCRNLSGLGSGVQGTGDLAAGGSTAPGIGGMNAGGDGSGGGVETPVSASKVQPEEMCSAMVAKPPRKCKVPTYMESLNLMASAHWLTVNDRIGDGILDQFIGEQTNTGLISALLLTIAVSNFYTALQPETPDVIVRWIPGFGPDMLSDMCICFYSMGVGGFMFATLSSVFYLLAANEAGTDGKVEVLLNHLGRWAQAPYLFFQVGILFWAAGYWTAGITGIRTTAGLVALLILQTLISAAFVMGSAQKIVQGTYVSQAASEGHEAKAFSKEAIETMLQAYATQVGAEHIDYAGFRRFMSTDSASQYYAGLTAATELRAKHVFDRELHRIAGVPQPRED